MLRRRKRRRISHHLGKPDCAEEKQHRAPGFTERWRAAKVVRTRSRPHVGKGLSFLEPINSAVRRPEESSIRPRPFGQPGNRGSAARPNRCPGSRKDCCLGMFFSFLIYQTKIDGEQTPILSCYAIQVWVLWQKAHGIPYELTIPTPDCDPDTDVEARHQYVRGPIFCEAYRSGFLCAFH
jgi:hypothetical protein